MRDEKTLEEIKENRLFQEARRLIELETKGTDDLIDAALDCRARTTENVEKLWKVVARSFSATLSLPAEGRCRNGAAVYWNEISAFLRDSGYTDERLAQLRARPEGLDLFEKWES